MRGKNMEGKNIDTLFARGCSQEINRSNFSSGRSKSKGISKYKQVGDINIRAYLNLQESL